MSNTKYKVGDRVVVKSLDWYNENKDTVGTVRVPCAFVSEMSRYCGKIVSIRRVNYSSYSIEESFTYAWSDEMFEGLAEETHVFLKSKDVKDLPKDFAECAKIMGFNEDIFVKTFEENKDAGVQKITVCRDAYWRLADGWKPDWKKNNAEDKAKGHKWIVGGNVNFFQGDARVSLIGLFNNVNQQNFSFEDILGVSGQQGGGGGRGRRGAVGQYMVRPQSGIALVNSVGANYSDEWGRRNNVKFQGSLFFNHTDTDNNSRTEKWYEAPMPIGYMYQQGVSNTVNYNARFNARLDWKISRNQSLMSRTSFSFQGNNPESTTAGYQFGQSGLLYQFDRTIREGRGYNFSEFLQYRVKLGKPGRTGSGAVQGGGDEALWRGVPPLV